MRGTKSKVDMTVITDNFKSVSIAADHINNMFSSVFMADTGTSFHADFADGEGWAPLTEPHEVFRWLSRLKPKATGSDKILTRLYKEGALFLSEPLSHLFNSCILEEIMPDLCFINDTHGMRTSNTLSPGVTADFML